MHGKAIWKPGLDEIAKASRSIASDPTGKFYSYPYQPPVASSHCADSSCVMVYGHKTQSFIKTTGQQKCLGKALLSKGGRECFACPPPCYQDQAYWSYIFWKKSIAWFLAVKIVLPA